MFLELATNIMCMYHDNHTTYLVQFYSDEHSNKNISLLLVRDFVNFSLLTSFYFSFTPALSFQSFSFLMLSVPIVDCLRNFDR